MENFDLCQQQYKQSKENFSTLQFYKFGQQVGKAIKGPYVHKPIRTIRDGKGIVQQSPERINKILKEYYASLYSKDQLDADSAVTFLEALNLPQITNEQQDLLNAQITRQEVEKAIAALPNAKSPGPDGYTSKYYKIMQGELVEPILNLYNTMWKEPPYFTSGKVALIKVLPKGCKDLLDPAAYRPISLINVDAKLLSKIIANRLAEILPNLINDSQQVFVKGRSGITNNRKVLAVLEHARRHSDQDNVIITLDAEKVFGNIDIDWLFRVLRSMGFRGCFVSFIRAQYDKPIARVNTGTQLSESFILQKVTRLGCPLSPLLFNLVFKPMARFILQSQQFSGINFVRG